jgi:hypothetical protein
MLFCIHKIFQGLFFGSSSGVLRGFQGKFRGIPEELPKNFQRTCEKWANDYRINMEGTANGISFFKNHPDI